MTINNKNIFLAFHFYRRPECKEFWSSLKAGVALLKSKGYTVYSSMVLGDPYIAKVRNTLAYRFLKSECDTFVFLGDDLQYKPNDLLRLIETPGDVVAGVYRIKTTKVNYPVAINRDKGGFPVVRKDGCISAKWIQTGFLRINRCVFEAIMLHYPERTFYGVRDGKKINMHCDFFPQGTGILSHMWVGEDYGFCELWRGLGGKIWIIPDMDLAHYENRVGYFGNYHVHLMCQPGGKLCKRRNKCQQQQIQ